jgi:hypothetical protein
VAKAKVGNGYYLAVISSRHYNATMERVLRKFSSFEEAEQHDIEYYIHLSVDQRQAIARMLKKRAYGDGVPNIRAYHKHK